MSITIVSGVGSERIRRTDAFGERKTEWDEKDQMALNLNHVIEFFKIDEHTTGFHTIDNRYFIMDIPYSHVLEQANGR